MVPESEIMTPAQCAEFLGVSKETLFNWRKRGGGPKWTQPTPRLVRYMRADVLAWLAEARV